GVEHRVVKEDGTIGAGPMYYCEKGIGGGLGKALGIMFAACGVLATLIGTGNMFQTNSMAVSAYDQFGIPQWITGLVIAGLVGAVILGGIKRIGAVAERLVPSMIGIYFLGAIAIILYNITEVPAAVALIVQSAFSPSAALGGVIGITIQQAIRFGVSRGILSNESGLGTAPIAHGAAKTDDPVKQGQIAMIGTFIDTIIVCSLTAIAITVTGAYKMGPLFVAEGQSLQGINMTMHAFNSVIPFGGAIVTIGSFLFGFSTLLGWCYYGEKCLEYLVGIKVRKVYQIVFIAFMFMGALPSPESISTVVIIGDIGNALMAIPNLFALLFLAKKVGQITRKAR
ncbi:MAG: amino acid carrier protein, partial [Calditrichota bacterium]